MNNAFRHPALQQLEALMPGVPISGLREVAFQKGMPLSCGPEASPQVWFPLGGLMTLEQPSGSVFVDVALIGCDNAVPLFEQGHMRLRALTDGHALCLPTAKAMSLCPGVLLGWQQALVQRMARLAACVRAHPPAQALADALLWAHRACPSADLAWRVHELPGCQRFSPDELDHVVEQWLQAGALRRQGSALQVHEAAVLASMACGCHANGPVHEAMPRVT